MGKVIELLTRDARSWSIVERELRIQLRSYGVQPKAEDRIANGMRAFWDLFDLGFTSVPLLTEWPGTMSADEVSEMSSRISAQLAAELAPRVNRKFHAFFVERLDREIEMCRELGIIPLQPQ